MKTAENKESITTNGTDPYAQVDDIVSKYRNQRGATIPILQSIQNAFGYVPMEALERISALTGIPESDLYSIVTFYAQFRLQPVGKNVIQVCHGTACHLAGAEKITEALQFETGAKAGGTSEDRLFTLEKVACLGCCSLAPVVTVNAETFGRLTPAKAQKLAADVRKREESRCEGKCHNEH